MLRSTSETQAANGALAHVGQPPIASLEQGTAASRVCLQRFADVRDALLRERDWNFAEAWVVPASSPIPGGGRFKKRYPLPEDCLFVRKVDQLGQDGWAIEASSINPGDDASQVMTLVCGIDGPRICYSRRVENPALWDALFLEVFQLRLAAAIAPLLAKSAALAERLAARADAKLVSASRRDAREKAATSIPRDTSWLRARSGGRFRTGYRYSD